MTIDDLILKLKALREIYGGSTPCITPGFDESGYDPIETVEPGEYTGPLDQCFGHTGRLEKTADLNPYTSADGSYHGTRKTRVCVLINF